MKILFTGASSFTGYWFVKELVAQGHDVVAPVRGAEGSYGGLRAARIAKVSELAEIAWGISFGDAAFLKLAALGSFDVLCHHAAEVGDYRNPAFDVLGAVAANTRSLPDVLRRSGVKGLLLSGSIFEPNEGVGSAPLRAFSPYGLSKGITSDIAQYWCATLNVPMGKFVIPNPFGAFEEPRFCAYLMKCWKAGETAEVKTPDYVRDNIHVALLAKCYAWFAEKLASSGRSCALQPSGYAESQGAFAHRVAGQLAPRLRLDCRVKAATQTDFSEPLVRINTTAASSVVPLWNEAEAWDNYADYYR